MTGAAQVTLTASWKALALLLAAGYLSIAAVMFAERIGEPPWRLRSHVFGYAATLFLLGALGFFVGAVVVSVRFS